VGSIPTRGTQQKRNQLNIKWLRFFI